MNKTNGGFLISQIKQIQGRIFEKMLVEAGIEEFNGAQGRILYVLWEKDYLPIVELSKRTGLAKTTLTSMLDRMEEQGHILRLPDTENRRQVRICLTDKARGMENKYREVSDKMNSKFYKGFEVDEIVDFESKLRLILENLEKGE